MTFEEAFHSGCRFRRPPIADNGWDDTPIIYWIKVDNNTFRRYDLPYNSYPINMWIGREIDIIANDWYLHPDDAFKNKLEDLIHD